MIYYFVSFDKIEFNYNAENLKSLWGNSFTIFTQIITSSLSFGFKYLDYAENIPVKRLLVNST